jgi:hypothetical protein
LTTYTNTKRPRNERRQVPTTPTPFQKIHGYSRAYLAEHYGFHCTCSVCSLPDVPSAISDKRLLDISASYNRLATWGGHKIGGSEAIGIVKKIWKLGSEEGYWSERGRLAADAVWVAASHSE